MSTLIPGMDARLDPVIYGSVQLLLSAAVIGFTPAQSSFRHAVIPVLFACSYSAMMYARSSIPQPHAGIFSFLFWLFFMSYVSTAIISGRIFADKGPASSIAKTEEADKASRDEPAKVEKKAIGSAWERLTFGLQSIFSFRDAATPFEVKNTPPFIYNDPSFVPSAPAFILRSAVTAIICYLVIDFIESQPPPPNGAQIFDSEKVSLLTRVRDITVQEAVTRIAVSSGIWVIVSCLVMGISSAYNVVCVALGMSKVETCKPLFGPMSEAYTIRGFWGKSWHQTTRKPFATLANYLVDNYFMFQKFSPPAVYSKVFVTFFFSGLLHGIADWSNGMDWEASGALKFFYFQAAGIIAEDAVQFIYRLIAGKTLHDPPRLWTRMLGYVWVGFFLLFWTSPGWFYPTARMNLANADLGPDYGKLIPDDFSYFRKYAKKS